MRRIVIVLLALLAIAASACGGREPLDPAEARRFFDTIDTLLDDVVAEHGRGNTEQASELAAQAYLENYEHLEADLIEADPELNEQLEGLLGTRLRRRIQQGISQEELEALVEEARGLLARARTALGVA